MNCAALLLDGADTAANAELESAEQGGLVGGDVGECPAVAPVDAGKARVAVGKTVKAIPERDDNDKHSNQHEHDDDDGG